MVICLERGADLHMAQLMPLPPTVSCFSKIQIGFTFLVPAQPGSPGKRPLNRCVCVILANIDRVPNFFSLLDFQVNCILFVENVYVSVIKIILLHLGLFSGDNKTVKKVAVIPNSSFLCKINVYWLS